MEKEKRIGKGIGFFGGVGMNNFHVGEYPAWRYHKDFPPIIVSNSIEDKKAKIKGYDLIVDSLISNRQLINWYWDLEDMSPKQLVVFAKEEFEVDLPVEARQESLMKAVCELSKFAPKNQDRLVLMAHTVKMSYDATMEEIKRMQSMGNSEGYKTEIIKEEFWL